MKDKELIKILQEEQRLNEECIIDLTQKLDLKTKCFDKLVIASDCNSREILNLTAIIKRLTEIILKLESRNLWKRIWNK